MKASFLSVVFHRNSNVKYRYQLRNFIIEHRSSNVTAFLFGHRSSRVDTDLFIWIKIFVFNSIRGLSRSSDQIK